MIEIIKLTQTCRACPTQWSAWTADDKHVYIRYRFGNLTVDVDGVRFFEQKLGNGLSGHILWDDVLAVAPIKMVGRP